MSSTVFGRAPRCRDERGFALPMALIGLVLISVLVTGVLLSSTSEVALSGAHRDATAALYQAEGAIESLIAAETDAFRQGSVALGRRDGWQVPDGKRADVNVAHLSRVPHPTLADEFVDLFSITASPAGGGRTVTAMVEVSPFTLGIDQAATFGGESKIQGNFLVSDGSDSQGLAEGTRSCVGRPGSSAIVHADGTTVTHESRNVHGEVVESELSADDLIRETLGGFTIREFAGFIARTQMSSPNLVKFGTNPLWGSAPGFPTGGGNSTKPRWFDKNGSVNVVRLQSNPFNWFCPGQMEQKDRCFEVPSLAQSDTTSYRFVLVDAGGGDIEIMGDHGQGVLVVLNGGIRLSGGFTFRGMILSEKDIDINGNGNKVEGAIISRNEVRVARPNDSGSELGGNAVVRFNRCTIDAIMGELNPPGGANRQVRLTSAWSELVR